MDYIVPIGARLFGEHHHPRALGFALVAFAGVAIVLFSAPPRGDASLRGNAFGLLAMLLWTAYVVPAGRAIPVRYNGSVARLSFGPVSYSRFMIL